MVSNIQKYKTDLDELIKKGEGLSLAMVKEFNPNQFSASIEDLKKELKKKKEKKEKIDQYIKTLKNLPLFTKSYQSWYSEALLSVKQLLPDRMKDFVRLYEKPKAVRKDITRTNYTIEDALRGTHMVKGYAKTTIVSPEDAIVLFEQQLNIVKSIKKRFESSLFDIKQLVQADLFDSELEGAEELNKKGFIRSAGVVAGIVLEKHLLQVCDDHKISVHKKNPGINDLAQLLKDSDIVDTPVWRNIQCLADLRNLCSHKRKAAPTAKDVDDLIIGVSKTIKTLF